MLALRFSSKVAANRVTAIAHKVARSTQMVFMPGRQILEGVVVLHETIHELHSKKFNGVIFKVDFENTYDKVEWPFLQQAMRMKGFPVKWCRSVDSFVCEGSVGVKVNNDIGHYFQTRKRVCEGILYLPSFSILLQTF
jgi:hypothetical protein